MTALETQWTAHRVVVLFGAPGARASELGDVGALAVAAVSLHPNAGNLIGKIPEKL